MIISKKKLAAAAAAALIISLLLIVLLGRAASRDTAAYVFSSSPASPVTVNGLPLPIPSRITVEKGSLRLDLEKISVNRYYIIYSLIYGDQSHTAYHLYLTDLSRKTLNTGDIGEIWLETAVGEKVFPVTMAPEITGFPTDQPLGWKIAVTASFPYQTRRNNHSLHLQYQDKAFKLTDISY